MKMISEIDKLSEEERRYFISEKTAKCFARIIVGVFLLLFVFTLIFIYSANENERENNIATQEVHDIIVEIYQEKNDIPTYRSRTGNGDWITINRPMVYSVSIGDSIIKEKGQAYFILKKKNSNQTSKWNF